jgi:hypothetical protein
MGIAPSATLFDGGPNMIIAMYGFGPLDLLLIVGIIFIIWLVARKRGK